MENSSKALIIAGAILISILIIGLGVTIFQNAQKVIKGSGNVDSQAAMANNERYQEFIGENATASDVKQLISIVNTNNLTARTKGENTVVGIVLDGAAQPNLSAVKILNGKTYTVKLDNTKQSDDPIEDSFGETDASYYRNGYIRVIVIKTNSK